MVIVKYISIAVLLFLMLLLLGGCASNSCDPYAAYYNGCGQFRTYYNCDSCGRGAPYSHNNWNQDKRRPLFH